MNTWAHHLTGYHTAHFTVPLTQETIGDQCNNLIALTLTLPLTAKNVEVMVPSPKAGQVLVQVAGSALNPIDLIKF